MAMVKNGSMRTCGASAGATRLRKPLAGKIGGSSMRERIIEWLRQEGKYGASTARLANLIGCPTDQMRMKMREMVLDGVVSSPLRASGNLIWRLTECGIMDDDEYKAFLALLVCSDPLPIKGLSLLTRQMLAIFANKEARARGYKTWVDAYQGLVCDLGSNAEVKDGD